MRLKIGELAKRIGLTIRALHHYEKIGLVSPSARTEAGYRLYDRNDITRLHKIQALRGLGLSLAQTQATLEGDGADLQRVVQRQIVALDDQITRSQALRHRLEALSQTLSQQDEPDLDSWLGTISMMATQRKYFSQEELDALQQKRGNSANREQWRALVREVRSLMTSGIQPDNATAKDVAQRWLDLSHQTMGDDPRFYLRLSSMHRNEWLVQTVTGIDGDLLDYIYRALHEARCDVLKKYLAPDELAYYREHCIRHIPQWLQLFADARQMIDTGIQPDAQEAQALMQRWQDVMRKSWGSNPATWQKMRVAHQVESGVMRGTGLDAAMRDFIEKGMAHLAQKISN